MVLGSIETHWFVDQRVRLITAVGHIDLEMLKNYSAESLRIYNAASQPIYVIADVRQLKTVPPLSECLKMPSLWDRRLAMLVTVGALQQPMMRMVFTVLVRIAHLKYRDMMTIEAAQWYIAASDPSLPPPTQWSPFAAAIHYP